MTAREAAAAAAAAQDSAAAVHEDNEWAIEVVPDAGDASGVSAASTVRQDDLAEGIEYSMPVRLRSRPPFGHHHLAGIGLAGGNL